MLLIRDLVVRQILSSSSILFQVVASKCLTAFVSFFVFAIPKLHISFPFCLVSRMFGSFMMHNDRSESGSFPHTQLYASFAVFILIRSLNLRTPSVRKRLLVCLTLFFVPATSLINLFWAVSSEDILEWPQIAHPYSRWHLISELYKSSLVFLGQQFLC